MEVVPLGKTICTKIMLFKLSESRRSTIYFVYILSDIYFCFLAKQMLITTIGVNVVTSTLARVHVSNTK